LDNKPNRISELADFSWKSSPRSSISGVHGLIASALGEKLVIWDVINGTIHRLLTLKQKILAVAFDEEFGVWAATCEKGYFVSINGKVLGKIELREKVSVLVSLALDASKLPRAAIAGTTSGSLFLLQPNMERGVIDCKKLPSEHRYPIESIVVSPTLKSFISIDKDEIAFIWTAPGIGGHFTTAGIYSRCHLCNLAPRCICRSCGRAVCKHCIGAPPETRCLFCIALEVI
jgi:hypothetical protein